MTAAMCVGAAAGGLALVLVGAGSVSFVSVDNSTLQLGTDPSMRGRVMSVWSVAFQGSTAIGGSVVGGIIAAAGARAGLLVCGATCFAAAVVGALYLRRSQPVEAT
jgi:MFS family permease